MPETSKERLADIESEPVQNRASIFAYIQNGLKTNPDGAAVISTFQAHDHLADLTQEARSALNDSTANGHTANGSSDCLVWSYKQLHSAALKVCAGLMALGVEPDMRIVTLVPNRVEWQLVLWTMSLLRVTLSSLDPGATTKPRRAELENFMSQIQPDVIIVADSEGANAVEAALKSHGSGSPKVKVQLDGIANSPWMSLSELAKTGANQPIDIKKLESSALQPDPDRTALIMFTSGTSSGNPKGCPRHVGSTCHVLETQDWGPRRFTSSSRALAATANFRIIAPTIHLALWKMGGAAVLPDPSQGMKGWISAISTHRITFILFIPALLHALVAHPDFSTSNMSSVEDIMQGGDMITRDLLIKTQTSFPHAKVAVGHGMTEGGGVFSWVWWDKKPDQLPYYASSIAPLGKIAPGARLRIRDPETGKVLKRNEPGELCMRCESLIKNYLNNINEDTSFYTDEKGLRWFRTGDLATINEDGVIYILGRIKDIIKRSGIPITPAALESCIEKFTGSYTSVLAWPHGVLGQVPVAVVKDLGGSGMSEDDVKKEVLEKFGKDYALEHVVGLKELGLESFPLNATGKIMKSELVPGLKQYLVREGKSS